MKQRDLSALVALCVVVASLLFQPPRLRAADNAPQSKGLAVAPDGTLLKDGLPYRGVGANYFDLLIRLLHDPTNTSSLDGLERLGEAGIPFVRFAIAFGEPEWKLVLDDRDEFFRRFDLVVRSAERADVGLIPSIFWHFMIFPDMVQEPRDQWGNPDSRTIALMRDVTSAIVERYKDSPAVWAWEFGNEPNLMADLPNAAQFRKKGGTETGDLTSGAMVTMLTEFAMEVRRHDVHRPIIAGHSHPRPSAWHNTAEKSWKADSRAQTLEIIRRDNPAPLDTVGIHIYASHDVPKELAAWARDHTEYLRAVRGLARDLKRPVFVGEFGVPAKDDLAATRAEFAQLLDAMETAEVDLAAFWVFDLKHQDKTWNVTFDNDRAFMLELTAAANRRWNQSTTFPEAAGTITMPDTLLLLDVPAISVETTVGHLPRLPRTIPGTYPDDVQGPNVRVIWPSPKDNAQVLQPGTYTVTGRVPGADFQPGAQVVVKPASASESMPRRVLEPFPLGQVVLEPDEKRRDTPQIRNRDKFIRGLAASDPDRFLYAFRDAFGQPQPDGVQPLGVWDSQTTKLRGHTSGHYLSAIAQAYAGTTYDGPLQATFLRKMDYLIETLYELSQKSGKALEEGGEFNEDPKTVPPGPGKAGYDSNLSTDGIRHDYWNWGKGFISAYPPDQFIMLEEGATYGGKDDQVWAPYYTLHKVLAGLLDCYEVGGNEKALEIARGMGLWVHARIKVVPESTRISMWNRYIAGEYGGMNEVMARLFRITGDSRFLECARLFDNIDFFFGNAQHDHGLARNVDTLRGKHANQHIPQITGALETYQGTQDVEYYRVAENFWDICTGCYAYSIGGVAGARTPDNAECFTAEPNTLFANGFAAGGQNETCATYNLLKLSRQLFMFNPDGKYMDYYEQALYNHILASVDEDNPGNTYHVPLNPGSRKRFDNANMSGFTCCNGTALESNTKLQDSIYFKSADNEALYVNLYVPSTVSWPQRNLVIRQQTTFPNSDTTRLTLNGEGDFEIKVRVPGWARRGFQVTINGEPQAVIAVPGTYLSLRRTWKNNDTIELRIPFDFYLCPLMDQPNVASIFYGPVLLAGEEPAPRTEWRRVTLDAEDLRNSIVGDPGTLRFHIGDMRLKPFCETYDRYSVYFDVSLK